VPRNGGAPWVERASSNRTAAGWCEPEEATSSFKHSTKQALITVAGKPGLDVPPGTRNAILKQAGLKN